MKLLGVDYHLRRGRGPEQGGGGDDGEERAEKASWMHGGQDPVRSALRSS